MRTTDAPVLRGAGAEEKVLGLSARATARQVAIDSCPEDCHYCFGPETD
ncbi:MAG: hypothetical protein JWM01_2991 [Arthrobacter sp.]|jgi:hypothetical protein|nr:hypothetical protein [Arthrobacter sp.]MCU1552814.1 hypothetical protein [Arthrobacter sp.]